MRLCHFRGCQEKAARKQVLCPEHYQLLLERAQRNLSEADSKFLIDHVDGCFAHWVAEHLGLQVDTIGGPGMFLDRRSLIRVLLRADRLRRYEEEVAAHVIALREVAPGLRSHEVPFQSTRPAPYPDIAEEDKSEKVSSQPRKQRRPRRAKDELAANGIAKLTGICSETIRRWLLDGLIPCQMRPWGNRGKTTRVVKMADLITFALANLPNPRFRLHHKNFRRFLEEEHADIIEQEP